MIEGKKCVFCGCEAEVKVYEMMEQCGIDGITVTKKPDDIEAENREEIEKGKVCSKCLQRINKLSEEFRGVSTEEVRVLEFYRATNQFAMVSTNAYGDEAYKVEGREERSVEKNLDTGETVFSVDGKIVGVV